MSSVETTVEPVRRTVTVNRPVEEAFRVFTEEIGKWWALDVHSLSLGRAGAPAETAVMEGRVGGRLYERMGNGEEADWGRLIAWEPPHRLALEWYITAKPTEVEVRFTPVGGGTRVELVHSGFEQFEDAAGLRRGYREGWDLGLGRYVEAANRSG